MAQQSDILINLLVARGCHCTRTRTYYQIINAVMDNTHFQLRPLHPAYRCMVSICSSLMQCLLLDIGGAPAALFLMTPAATLDPLTARHYIWRHYLNTQQSEIEFRAPSPVPRHPPPPAPFAGSTGPL